MASEYASVGVQLIDHDITQVLEQAHPFCVVRENAGVQHVGIRQDNVPALSNRLSRITWSIAVVREYAEPVVKAFRQLLQFSQLILSRLGLDRRFQPQLIFKSITCHRRRPHL